VLRAERAAAAAGARRNAAAETLAAAEERRGEAERRAGEAETAAGLARSEVDTLEATVGEEARQIVERHAAARQRLERLEEESERLAAEREEAAGQRIRAETLASIRRQELEERDQARQESARGLRGLAADGLLELVLDAGVEEMPEAEWPFTRALELARAIERVTTDVDLAEDAAGRRANRVHERYQRLGADIGADYQPSLRQDGDLILVRILYNGQEHAPGGLLARLREAAEVRRGLLAEHERDLLRRFLLGEVGDHLRRRLRQAGELVHEMNEQLSCCATASGMVLRLAWRPDAEADPAIRDVVDLLRRDPHLLPEDSRRRLEEFFQRQIEVARGQWAAVPWRQHLMQALDYRRWHRFQVQQRSGLDGPWQELTRHGHAAISGGEKAVALHLPLFAAAAAHYRSALGTAPRLILLDEAFAGIDQKMRGRCMALLVEFDLDFMMTSYDEWGCYEELPGLAIYQLYRDPAFEGVAAVPFLWNGLRLQEGRLAGEES
jgi:SbcC/RAD50-like, Walker B motif